MENHDHCKSIKQAKLIVNAHKHNLLNSFCNNGYVYVTQYENTAAILLFGHMKTLHTLTGGGTVIMWHKQVEY